MTKIDVRSDLQKLREERAEKVIALYKKVRACSVGSNYGVIRYVVDQLKDTPDNITEMGVYHILKTNGILETKNN